MNGISKLALLAAMLAGAELAAATPASLFGIEAQATARIAQAHGAVTKPEHPCGWRLIVTGAPGAHYAVYVSSNGSPPTLFDSGTIFPWGSVVKAISVVGCQPTRPTERVVVTSQADSPISVQLEFF